MGVGPGTMVDAGFIDLNGKITPKAKAEFIRQVKEELKNGSGNAASFPCGLDIPPDPTFDLDLENEDKYPDFHKNSFLRYEQIAQMLNVQGNFSLLPICDPLALKAKLNPDLDLKVNFKKGEFIEYLLPNLPNLAVKFELEPPELALKFPGLIGVPDIPKIPEFKVPQIPPDFSVPDLGQFSVQFPELLKFNQPYLKIPDILSGLLPKMPNLGLKIASLDIPSVFTEICKEVNSKAFPPPDLPKDNPSPPSDFSISIAVANVTSRMMTAMVTATAAGLSFGSAPDGIVGGIGVEAKVKDEEPEEQIQEQKELTIRDKIATKALRAIGKEHGGSAEYDLSYYRNKEEYAKFLLYTEYGDGTDKSILSKDDPNYDPRVVGSSKAMNSRLLGESSCGMTARACLWSAGASVVIKGKEFGDTGLGKSLYREVEGVKYYYNFFTDTYKGFDLYAIVAMARKMGKDVLKYSSNTFGPGANFIKKGDIFVTGNIDKSIETNAHMCVAISDFDGESFETVEGGQANPYGLVVPKDAIGCRTIKRFKYYDKSTYKGPQAAYSGDGNERGSHRQMTIKNGTCILGRDRKNYIWAVIDGEAFVTNKNFTQIKNPNFETTDLNLLRNDETINLSIVESLDSP